MPESCAATGCENRQDKNRPDLVFKQIPCDKKLNAIWEMKIKCDSYPKDKNTVLCSEHFSEDCFERDLKAEFKHKWTTPLYKIKDDAIPTIFAHKDNSRRRLSSEKRLKKRAKRELLSDVSNVRSLSVISGITAGPSDSASMSFEEAEIDEVYDESYDESRVDAAIMVDASTNTDVSFHPNSDVYFPI